MLTTVAALVIVLGLMVSLARFVRDRSAQQLTKTLLINLDELAARYKERTGKELVVTPLIEPGANPPEAVVRAAAQRNNEEMVKRLQVEFFKSGILEQDSTRKGLGDLPIALYDRRLLADSWGNPIVHMSDQHPLIGMAPRSRPGFFFSAGPDGKYLTRDDNLYSYEQAVRK